MLFNKVFSLKILFNLTPFLCFLIFFFKRKLINAQHPKKNDCFGLNDTSVRKSFNRDLRAWEHCNTICFSTELKRFSFTSCMYTEHYHFFLLFYSFYFYLFLFIFLYFGVAKLPLSQFFRLESEDRDFSWDGQHHTGQSRNRRQMAWLAQWNNQKIPLFLERTYSYRSIIDLLKSCGLKSGCLERTVFFSNITIQKACDSKLFIYFWIHHCLFYFSFNVYYYSFTYCTNVTGLAFKKESLPWAPTIQKFRNLCFWISCSSIWSLPKMAECVIYVSGLLFPTSVL